MRSLMFAAACLLAGSLAHAQSVITDGAVGRAAPARTAPSPGLITNTDINGLVFALQRAGFTAEVKTEGRASYVLGRLGTTPFQAFLAGCRPDGGACTEIELYAGFSNTQRIPLERINGWNARTRFARAFLDEEGDPALQLDIGLDGGVSPDGLKATLETWGSALETYALFLLARVPPVGAVAPPGEPKAVSPKR